MNDYFEIGKIVNTQGIKGDVRIVPQTSDIKRFESLKTVDMYRGNIKKTLTIEKVWYHKKFVIIKFLEVKNMNDAEELKEFVIRVDRKDAIPLEEDEFYITDLIGVSVIDDMDNKIGIIKDVLVTGANDVYVVKTDGKDILLPAIKQCILDVNMEEKIMKVHIMKGLLD